MLAARQQRYRELDAKVVRASKGVRILGSLSWPEDSVARFEHSRQQGSPEPPQVCLSPPTDLPADRDLADLQAALDPADPVEAWLGRTVEDLRVSVALLQSIGTADFTARSLELYGRPSDPVHPGAPSALESAQHFLRTTERLQPAPAVLALSDEEAAAWLRERVARYFPTDPPKVELDPHLASLASAGSTRIRLRQGARFSRVQLRQLLHHEALVHTATRRNGKEQPVLQTLGLSLPRTTATQEGLASLAELVSDTMDLARLRRLALRVVAIRQALEGASFVDVWRFFVESGQTEDESFHSTRRVFRGGDACPSGGVFTKDAVYVGGLMRVQGFFLTAIRDGRKSLPLRLFAGRLTSGDVVDLEPAFEEGTIAPPITAPDWVREQDCLAAYLTVGGLLTRVDLDQVELEDFTER